MRRKTMTSVVMLWAFASTVAHAQTAPLQETPDGRRLVLVFADEFTSFRPIGSPSGIWRTTYGDGTQKGLDRRSLPTNGEMEIYVDRDLADATGKIGLDPFRIHDGVLDIVAEPTPASLVSRLRDYRYVSGVISSQPSFFQLHGYFEMRAKIPGGKGVWPAFWMVPEDLTWPPEIDVMESVGDASHIYATAHSNLLPPAKIEANIAPDVFHTYAVSWDAKRLIFYVDNRMIGAEPTPPDFTKPMYLIANLAIGGNWPGAPDSSTKFPVKLSIDYIRAYRFAHD